MKKFLSLLLVISLLALTLSSCSLTIKDLMGADKGTDTITPGENELPLIPPSSQGSTKTADLQFTYAYDHTTLAATGEKLATLLVAGSYLMNGFSSVNIPEDAVAGDIITIKYTGEIVTQESYPAMTNLKNGTLKSYSIKYAEVIHLTGDEINAENIKSEYDFEKSYVIIDKVGRFVSLESYSGKELYLVVDQQKMINQDSDDMPVPIACMLAYDPRIVSE